MWPGDANRNGICNNVDILWIGLASQDEIGGPSRPDADFSWTAQTPGEDWASSFPVSGINYLYADTDGNGWIDGTDLNIFPELAGQTNEFFSGLLGAELPGDDLFFEVSNLAPSPGEEVTVSIHLGDPDNIIQDIYGIAFDIGWDTSIVNEDATVFEIHGGWLGFVPAEEFYSYIKLDSPSGLVEPSVAFTRVRSTPATGQGEIMRMRIVIEDVIVGLDGLPVDSVALDLSFKNVLGLNAFEEDLLITSSPKSLLVTSAEKLPLVVPPDYKVIQDAQHLKIFAPINIQELQLLDVAGRVLYRRAPDRTEHEIPITGHPAGIYLLSMRFADRIYTSKVWIPNSS